MIKPLLEKGAKLESEERGFWSDEEQNHGLLSDLYSWDEKA